MRDRVAKSQAVGEQGSGLAHLVFKAVVSHASPSQPGFCFVCFGRAHELLRVVKQQQNSQKRIHEESGCSFPSLTYLRCGPL